MNLYEHSKVGHDLFYVRNRLLIFVDQFLIFECSVVIIEEMACRYYKQVSVPFQFN